MGLLDRLAACLEDRRQPGKLRQDLDSLLAQRVHALACGYPDGNAGRQVAVLGVLRRLVDRLHRAFPRTPVLGRLDSGFVFLQIFDYLDRQPRLDYVVAYARNSVLDKAVRHDLRLARRASKRSGQSERLYGQVFCKARKWPRERQVLLTAATYVLFQEIRLHARRTDHPTSAHKPG